jgi:hypothetical protein
MSEKPAAGSSERIKAALEIKKLRAEISKLHLEAGPLGLTTAIVPSLVSVLTAVVAITGVALSVFSLYEQRRAKSDESHDRAFTLALDMATNDKGMVDRRISGIYQLRRFWSFREDEAVVGATLTSLLQLPDSPNAAAARCAAAEVIGAATDSNDAGAVSRRAHLLFGNAQTGALGLVSYANFLISHQEFHATTAGRTEPGTAFDGAEELSCATPLFATREAIRKNWRYLRNTNLQSTDLRSTHLYASDLAGANLSGADLRGADLRCANLANSILDNTRFDGADMRFANLPSRYIVTSDSDAIAISDQDWQTWKSHQFAGAPARGVAKPPSGLCLGPQ